MNQKTPFKRMFNSGSLIGLNSLIEREMEIIGSDELKINYTI